MLAFIRPVFTTASLKPNAQPLKLCSPGLSTLFGEFNQPFNERGKGNDPTNDGRNILKLIEIQRHINRLHIKRESTWPYLQEPDTRGGGGEGGIRTPVTLLG
jgi:hypothetical protein